MVRLHAAQQQLFVFLAKERLGGIFSILFQLTSICQIEKNRFHLYYPKLALPRRSYLELGIWSLNGDVTCVPYQEQPQGPVNKRDEPGDLDGKHYRDFYDVHLEVDYLSEQAGADDFNFDFGTIHYVIEHFVGKLLTFRQALLTCPKSTVR